MHGAHFLQHALPGLLETAAIRLSPSAPSLPRPVEDPPRLTQPLVGLLVAALEGTQASQCQASVDHGSADMEAVFDTRDEALTSTNVLVLF